MFLGSRTRDYSGFPCPHRFAAVARKQRHVKKRSRRFFRNGFSPWPSDQSDKTKRPPCFRRGAFLFCLADRTGLEPATSGVTGRHSNQLNYRSVIWWVMRDLNSRHSPCKGDALPTELITLGFEARNSILS